MKLKLKWKVDPIPTGPFASFQQRGWPTAYYPGKDEKPAARIDCSDSYVPTNARAGQHDELKVGIADYTVTPWKWRTLKQRCKTLSEAKRLALHFLTKYPELQPKP